jgi:hypothetical protein
MIRRDWVRLLFRLIVLLGVPITVSGNAPWQRRVGRIPANTQPLTVRRSAKFLLSHQRRQSNKDAGNTSRHGRAPSGDGFRGGGSALTHSNNNHNHTGGRFERALRGTIQLTTATCQTVLPAVVHSVRTLHALYTRLPVDLVLAETGLVYAFAGGYFPTLFAAVRAAQHCGWDTMVEAIDALATEAVSAVEACPLQSPEPGWHGSTAQRRQAREIFTEKTLIVLRTIDPMKINQAVAALYTTWMGVAVVLARDFARTIALAVTLGDYLRPVANLIVGVPARRVVPEPYHKWIPVVIAWICKGAAMSIAWRIQRVLTAYSSAISGGLMFSRSMFRFFRKRGFRFFGVLPPGSRQMSLLEEMLGFMVATLGLYSQIGNGINWTIPFPLSLVTWPFEWAERWLQWQFTEDTASRSQ